MSDTESKPRRPEADSAELRRRLAEALARAERNDAAVAELRRSQELTRRLIEAMPGGVVHVSNDGAIVTANAEAQRILGLSRDALTQRFTADFETETIFEDGSPCSMEEYPVSRALMTGQAQPPVTIGVRRPDGTVSWAVFTAVPINDDGGATTGAVVTFIDISRRKELERTLRQAQKMEGLGRLAGGIAHDFNNLLMAIAGNAYELEKAFRVGDPRRDDVRQVLGACERGRDLTQQMLAFASRQPVAPRVSSLVELVQTTAGLMRRAIGPSIELELELADSVPPVEIDPTQFEQVLLNLSINARDAMPSGGTLRLKVDASDGDARLAVIDDGVGIEPLILEHVFEPFFSTKSHHQGSGLGLATCYGIVSQAGGTIRINSTPGRGTTVEVRLPATTREPSPAAMLPVDDSIPGGSESILLVEDDPAVSRVVSRVLRDLGYRVLVVSSGADALKVLADDESVSLLLTDVIMPGMGGVEIARWTHEARPSLPVVFMSGYAEDALDSQGMLRWASAFVRKPFEPATLAAVVRRILDGKR